MSTTTKKFTLTVLPVEAPPPPAYRITMDLTQREAVALHTMTRRISGAPDGYSPRDIFDRIGELLKEANVPTNRNLIEGAGSIYFNSYELAEKLGPKSDNS